MRARRAVSASASRPTVRSFPYSVSSDTELTGPRVEPGVQFYTNNLSAPEKGARKKIHGGSGSVGDGYPPGSTSLQCSTVPQMFHCYLTLTAAAFLEFHAPLAAWIHPSARGPSGEDTLLASGEVYNNFVRLDVWYRDGA